MSPGAQVPAPPQRTALIPTDGHGLFSAARLGTPVERDQLGLTHLERGYLAYLRLPPTALAVLETVTCAHKPVAGVGDETQRLQGRLANPRADSTPYVGTATTSPPLPQVPSGTTKGPTSQGSCEEETTQKGPEQCLAPGMRSAHANSYVRHSADWRHQHRLVKADRGNNNQQDRADYIYKALFTHTTSG